MGRIGAVGVETVAANPYLITKWMVFQIMRRLAGSKVANKSSVVNVEDCDCRVLTRGGSPNVLLSIRYDVMEAAVPVGWSCKGVRVFANNLRADVRKLLLPIRAEDIDPIAGEEPHGVANVGLGLFKVVVINERLAKACWIGSEWKQMVGFDSTSVLGLRHLMGNLPLVECRKQPIKAATENFIFDARISRRRRTVSSSLIEKCEEKG
mmetsp:Transcript_42066/g.101426  ORF Transcript_42066/g.101426 Transcript_42066/m.101426 type:complete len:208 (+) Transcript_42066:1643-2266(+)